MRALQKWRAFLWVIARKQMQPYETILYPFMELRNEAATDRRFAGIIDQSEEL